MNQPQGADMASSRCLSQDHPYSKVESNGSFTQAHLPLADAPASCTTTSLSLYVISYQRSLSKVLSRSVFLKSECKGTDFSRTTKTF